MDNTNNPVQVTGNEAVRKQMLISKLEAVRRYPDTLLLSPDPVGVLDEIIKANRILSLLRKSILKGKTTADEFLEIQKTYMDEVAEPVWQGIVSIMPQLATGVSPLQNWRKFDDPIYEKEILVSRSFKITVGPRAEVIGVLGVIHKLLYKISVELNSTDNNSVYQLSTLGQIYRDFKERLTALNNSLLTKYSIVLPKRKAARFNE